MNEKEIWRKERLRKMIDESVKWQKQYVQQPRRQAEVARRAKARPGADTRRKEVHC